MSSFYNHEHRYNDRVHTGFTRFGYAWEGEPYKAPELPIPDRFSEFFCAREGYGTRVLLFALSAQADLRGPRRSVADPGPRLAFLVKPYAAPLGGTPAAARRARAVAG